MSELPQLPPDDDLSAEEFQKRVAARLDAQHQELRDQARALISAVKGARGIRDEKHWERLFEQAKIDQQSGRFIIKRLGAERFLEPELMATLGLLRKELTEGIERPTAADRMMADSAVIAYYNMLRVQGWIGSLCLVVEGELFGQEPIKERVAEELSRLDDVLMPLAERCHRMMAKSLNYLQERRPKPAASPLVAIGQAGQVNVDSAVVNGQPAR